MVKSSNMPADSALWPDVDVSLWAGTKRSLHLYSQMLGKVKVAVAPMRPNWMFTRLFLSARGVTTGTIPWRGWSFEATIDVFKSAVVLSRSNGARTSVPLVPPRTVAEIYADLQAALESLGVSCTISPIPQELPDTTPLDQDRRPSEYDPAAAVRWFQVATAVSGIFDVWRSHFSGRTGLQLWWGAFDVALMLFSGRRLTPPTDRGYLLRYDHDAELMNVGFYLGDEKTRPLFYGYIYPEPPAAPTLPIAPAAASWSTDLHEWVLPYQAVKESPDPPAAVRSFLDAIYESCFTAAGWSRGAYSYDAPKPSTRA